MASKSTVVVRRSRFCTFLKVLCTVQALVVVIVSVLLVRNLGEEASEPQVGTESGQELRTYEGMIARARAGANVPGSLGNFWIATLQQAGTAVHFREPEFSPYRADYPQNAECQVGEGRNNAFYCSRDHHTILYDENYLHAQDMFQGRFAPLTTIAHEYGHHISQLRHGWAYIGGPTAYSIQEELQADCFAGMYLRHTRQLFGLQAGEAFKVAEKFFKLGDLARYGANSWFKKGRHGKPRERLLALARGFGLGLGFGLSGTSDAQRFQRCEKYRRYKSEQIAQLGPHSLAIPDLNIDPVDGNRVRITGNEMQAHLRYFAHEPSFAEYSQDSLVGAEELSDMKTELLEEPSRASQRYGTWYMQWYERSYLQDGESVTTHGQLVLRTLKQGGAIGLDVFRLGAWPSARDASRKTINIYREKLEERLSLAQGGG